ncbi:elongation factor P [Candidatus Poribacteria bacterium]|nr:elongation factor P [Candidatus Poribacteria bacterium]
MIPARQLKIGMVILYNKDLYRVGSVLHLTPGNLRAMVQAKLYNLKNGNYYDMRFRADESLEMVMLDRKTMEYLYNTGDAYTFMDTTTYEQIDIPVGVLGEAVNYLLPNTQLKVEFYNSMAVGIELPITVDLEIVETDPPMKGATASGSPKAAKLETGIVVKVPQFLQIGDVVRIDTRDNSFVERAKK